MGDVVTDLPPAPDAGGTAPPDAGGAGSPDAVRSTPPEYATEPGCVRFNPQDLVRIFPDKLRSARWVGLFGIFAAVLITLAAITQGRLGSASDFQVYTDFQRILGRTGLPDSPPSFPLIRDIPSWFLLTSISLGAMLLRYEWNLMTGCIPGLLRNRVLVPHAARSADGGPAGYKDVDLARTYGSPWLIRLLFVGKASRIFAPRNKDARERLDAEIATWPPANALTVFLGAMHIRARRL